MRKKVSELQLKIRHEIVTKMGGFKKYFLPPVPAKMRYLEELGMYKFHKYALLHTYNLSEYEFRQWIKTDDAFREAVNSLRQQFIDELEYLMLARAGYYGAEKQKRYMHVHNQSLGEYIKVARGYGIYRKYTGHGWFGKAGTAKDVPDGGDGKGGPGGQESGQGGVCSVSETDVVP